MNDKKKLDVIVKYFYPVAAGIETNILETYSVLARLGWEVTVHASRDTLTEKNCLAEEFSIRGLKVKRYCWTIFGFWPKIDWSASQAVCLHNFNIFPHFQIMAFALFLRWRGRKRFALFLTPHGGFNPEWRIFPSWAAALKKFYHYSLGVWLINRSIDGVRAVSEWERLEMIKKGLRPEKIMTIDNGLEDEAFADLDQTVDDGFKAKIEAWGDYIIQVGRVYMIKNYETVLRALPMTDRNLKYVIVGPLADVAYKKKLDRLISELGLAERVIFAGVQRSYEKYYAIRQAQMMVHMALWESYCNVVHEGLSQGLVCIVADNTALPLLVRNKENGFTVETMDHEALAERINHVYNNRRSDAIMNMKKSNRARSLDNSWQKVAGKMDGFYRKYI